LILIDDSKEGKPMEKRRPLMLCLLLALD